MRAPPAESTGLSSGLSAPEGSFELAAGEPPDPLSTSSETSSFGGFVTGSGVCFSALAAFLQTILRHDPSCENGGAERDLCFFDARERLARGGL